MKIKKTIAAVAAAAMVFSTVPMMVFADPVEHTDDHTFTYTAKSGESNKHTKSCATADCSFTAVDESCSAGDAEISSNKHVTKCKDCGQTLTETDHAAAEAWQKDGSKHWHACKTTGCDTKFGEGEHSYTDGTCTCGATEGGSVTPPSGDDEPTDAEKLAEVNAAIDTITANNGTDWNFHAWVAISGLDGWAGDGVVNVIQSSLTKPTDAETDPGFGLTGAEVTLVGYTVADDSDLVTFTIKVKIGTAETTRDVVLKCLDDRVAEGGGDVEGGEQGGGSGSEGGSSSGSSDNTSSSSSSSDSSSSAPAASSSSSAPAAATASSASQVASAVKPNVTVNAAETKVTTAMVTAFTKNSKAQTLTLSYSAKVKVAIDKKDVKAAAAVAKLDFSTTGKNFISTAAVKKNATLAKAEKVVQMNFTSTGKLEGVDKVTVKNRVGAKYAGQKVTVYEYVNGKLVKVAKTTVGGSGLVNFKIDHFGQYVIAVD